MAHEMTQRQRAEALYGSLTCTTYREGYQDPDNDIGIIEQALTTARQEALREVVIVISQFSTDQPLSTNELRIALMQALDRLTREGVTG